MLDIIKQRHTIRTYNGEALQGEVLETLERKIKEINDKTGLHFQLINGKENAFDDYKIRYGKWTNVTNYIALVGKENTDELCGYYGEQLVLWAQEVGLKTGWVETSYEVKPEVLEVKENEQLIISIAIGYSDLTGFNHKVRPIEALSEVEGEAPEWFNKGMEYVQYAPSAGNQQVFTIHWNGQLSITTKPGFLEKVDVGVVQYHFELGAGIDHSMWSK